MRDALNPTAELPDDSEWRTSERRGLLVDEHKGVAAVLGPPELCSVGLGAGRTRRRSPPLDVIKIGLNLKPHASRFGRTDPARNAAAAFDADSLKLLQGQQTLDLDPHKLVDQGELSATGSEQPRFAGVRPLPARLAVGLGSVSHLNIFNQRRRISFIFRHLRRGPTGYRDEWMYRKANLYRCTAARRPPGLR